MSSSSASRRRSGDPRKRASAGPTSPSDAGRRRVVVAAALAVSVALVALAVASARPHERPAATAGAQEDQASVHPQTLVHAEVACDLTSKAEQAAASPELAERVRYAAAVLLLDQAIVESARAARSDARLSPLDTALREVHTAGHEGDHRAWRRGLRSADAACRDVLG